MNFKQGMVVTCAIAVSAYWPVRFGLLGKTKVFYDNVSAFSNIRVTRGILWDEWVEKGEQYWTIRPISLEQRY